MTEMLLLTAAVCMDSFFTAFSYGSSGIKIPPFSAIIISAVGALFLGASLIFSGAVGGLLSAQLCVTVSFGVLVGLGVFSLLQNGTKALLRRSKGDKRMCFKWGGIGFMLEICLDETKADRDNSKAISCGEALALAAALSLDSLASGFGAGLSGINVISAVLSAFVGGMLAVCVGAFIGRRAKEKSHRDLSWLSGVVLLALAAAKIV